MKWEVKPMTHGVTKSRNCSSASLQEMTRVVSYHTLYLWSLGAPKLQVCELIIKWEESPIVETSLTIWLTTKKQLLQLLFVIY